MSTTINAPAGFFQNDAVTPTTITDLLSAVEGAINNVSGATASAAAAAASALASADSAVTAAGSANSATTAGVTAATGATNAAASAATATTQASAAATSASAASGSATTATTQAAAATTSATGAATSATAAANSASGAATSATNAAASATSAANSAARTAPIINVMTAPYNAVGNFTADDRAAIQAAIDACAAAGGGDVFFPRPPVAYGILDSLVLKPGVTLLGEAQSPGYFDGWDGYLGSANAGSACRIKAQINFHGGSGGAGLIECDIADLTNAARGKGFGVRDLILDGNDWAQNIVNSQGASFIERLLTLENVTILRAWQTGVTTSNIPLRVTRCNIFGNAHYGLELSVTDSIFADNYIHSNALGGIVFDTGSTHNVVSGGKIEENFGYGAEVYAGAGDTQVSFIGVEFQHNTSCAVKADGGGGTTHLATVTLHGCILTDNGYARSAGNPDGAQLLAAANGRLVANHCLYVVVNPTPYHFGAISSGKLWYRGATIRNDASTALAYTASGGTVTANPATLTASDLLSGSAAGQNEANYLINPDFNVQQRGTGPFNFQYGPDGYNIEASTSTNTGSIVALSDTDRTNIGDENAVNGLQLVVGGTAGAGDFAFVWAFVEKLHRLSGKTVTISFWAKAASGTPKIAISFDQLMGTGGTPSSDVIGNGQSVTISTTMARYSMTFALGSLSGLTTGTNGDDRLRMAIWLSAGSTFNSRTNTLGQQSATFTMRGLKLEVGPTATAFVSPTPEADLHACQRFYNTFAVWVPTTATKYTLTLTTTMRAAPTIAGGGTGFAASNVSGSAATIGQTTAANQTLTFSAEF